MNLPPRVRRLLGCWRRCACEAIGIRRYSRPALDGLDWQLEQYVDFDGGFFVEAGANDGVMQSNTYYLERFRGWTGLLIEGIPSLAKQCRKNRPRSTVVQAALVEAARPGDTVEMHYAGLMSAVAGAMDGVGDTDAHVRHGLEIQGIKNTYIVRVPARTLTDVIQQHRPEGNIDLLSLDVEGMETQVLRGLDFSRYAPHFLCIEARRIEEIKAVLGDRYVLRAVLADKGSRQDLLFQSVI
jgi:FkbM family methyltransferase